MEDIVLEILNNKGALKEKELFKKFVNKCTKCVDGNKEHNQGLFQTAINTLISGHQVLNKNGEFCVNKVVVKKRKRSESEGDDVPVGVVEDGQSDRKWYYPDLWKNGEKFWRENTFDPEYLRLNPDRITRLFCGNLNKLVTEEDLRNCLPGITFIKWITDKSTGEFYGSSFIEMKDPAAAALAVSKDKDKFMGRPLKIYYCPPRPGDNWPPVEGSNKKANTGSTVGGSRPKTPKPEGGRKLFAGNLAYEIDDDIIVDFFKDCGTMTGLRWLTRQGTNEFRVSWDTESISTPFLQSPRSASCQNCMQLHYSIDCRMRKKSNRWIGVVFVSRAART